MGAQKLEDQSDEELQRLYLIENIREHQKSAWSKPSNLIAIASLFLSLILGSLTVKLSESNESKSLLIQGQEKEIQEQQKSLDEKNAVLLSEKEKVLETINAPQKSTPMAFDEDKMTDESKSLVAISKVTNESSVKTGWMFLGKLDSDGMDWASGSPQTIERVPYNTLRHRILKVTDEVYIREDSGKIRKSQEKVTDVALIGDRFKVLEIYESPAKSGGPFIWARVHRILGAEANIKKASERADSVIDLSMSEDKMLSSYDDINVGMLIYFNSTISEKPVKLSLYDNKPSLIGVYGKEIGRVGSGELLVVQKKYETFRGYKWLKVEVLSHPEKLTGWYSWENINTNTFSKKLNSE